jgi:hypothetical protein
MTNPHPNPLPLNGRGNNYFPFSLSEGEDVPRFAGRMRAIPFKGRRWHEVPDEGVVFSCLNPNPVLYFDEAKEEKFEREFKWNRMKSKMTK